MNNKEALLAIDKQIITWIEDLDKLTKERADVNKRIAEIESRLSSMKQARRALAAEWGEPNIDLPIPLKYLSEGVTGAIIDIFVNSRKADLTVDEIVEALKSREFDFKQKNPRRVVNMSLVNNPDFAADGTGKYSYNPEVIEITEEIESEDLPFNP